MEEKAAIAAAEAAAKAKAEEEAARAAAARAAAAAGIVHGRGTRMSTGVLVGGSTRLVQFTNFPRDFDESWSPKRFTDGHVVRPREYDQKVCHGILTMAALRDLRLHL